MKIVFLDFDGVLNHLEWASGQPHPRPPFDPACVRRVARICERTGARIVVSSSWRTREQRSITWLRGLLIGAGLGGKAYVVGMTPDHQHTGPRADEIRAFLASPPKTIGRVESFAILDDDADAGEGLGEHFVQTDFERGGLLDEHVERAVQILGRLT